MLLSSLLWIRCIFDSWLQNMGQPMMSPHSWYLNLFFSKPFGAQPFSSCSLITLWWKIVSQLLLFSLLTPAFPSPSTSSLKCQVLCILYGTPKGSDTSNQVQNFRLLFVRVTLFSHDLPKLLLPVHRQGSCSILPVWLADDLRDRLFISTLVESKIWPRA